MELLRIDAKLLQQGQTSFLYFEKHHLQAMFVAPTGNTKVAMAPAVPGLSRLALGL
ncbi:hypothetical protein ACO0LB_09490 [Undibacterium sp. SXout7W]|uniref:hypothetical protein n=1 Tax=Undibacterium sp. SXout7W TaxID=3413049 RepID=UPI003BF262F1